MPRFSVIPKEGDCFTVEADKIHELTFRESGLLAIQLVKDKCVVASFVPENIIGVIANQEDR